MNQPTPDSPEVIARRRKEVSGLLKIAREQGYRILPDPDRRGICVGFTLPGRTHLSGTALELLRREREVYDHLAALGRLAVAVLEDDDLADAGVAPARSPGEASTEGAPGPRVGPHGSIPPSADRTPSIPPSLVVDGVGREPVMYHPCPACDPGRPCFDHGGAREQVPPPMPGWLVVTAAVALLGTAGLLIKVLLFPGDGL